MLGAYTSISFSINIQTEQAIYQSGLNCTCHSGTIHTIVTLASVAECVSLGSEHVPFILT